MALLRHVLDFFVDGRVAIAGALRRGVKSELRDAKTPAGAWWVGGGALAKRHRDYGIRKLLNV